ncbi:MAG: DUF6538 domain-containing protein [Gluconobacter potus]|uniref:DUF6538 domain-containing protein n=1 Tax=Gluconobacter TaxID=441 RepID=UPI001D17D153|nr:MULTISPECIES: DUF6538 domain-containing protein [Gluconobacter]
MLIRLQSGLHFRRGIPARFQTALGKREIWHSLDTLDRNLARTRACVMYGLTSQLFECISLTIKHAQKAYEGKCLMADALLSVTNTVHPSADTPQILFESVIQAIRIPAPLGG